MSGSAGGTARPRRAGERGSDRLAVISSDTDWVEEETMAEAHALLTGLGFPVTYFVTQPYAALRGPAPVPVEIAPHPNFRDPSALDEELARCLAFAPGAISCRAHSCFWSERLRPVLRRQGIRYSSSAMQYLQPGIVPFEIGHAITEVPLYWMDMFHLEMCELGGRPAFDAGLLRLEEPGLKVLDVHPVHLVLNTRSLAHYADARAHYHEPEALAARRAEGPGVRTLFVAIVERLRRLGYRFCLVRDVAAACEETLARVPSCAT